MQYEWDENKRRTNLEKHGEDCADVDRLDWSRAHIKPDRAIATVTPICRLCPTR